MSIKIKYICNYNGNPNSGVTKKIISQVQGMRHNNIDAKLILLYKYDKSADFKGVDFISFKKFPSPPYENVMNKLKVFFTLHKAYKELINDIDDNVIIYLRNFYPSFGFYNLLKNTKKKIVIDVVSNNREEASLRNSVYYKYKLKLWSNLIAKNSTAIVGVTKEIIGLNFPKLNKEIPTVAIGNGFNVNSVPLNPIPKNNNIINFICVASFNKWHGIDRFLYGMKNYSNNRNIHLHLVGTGPRLLYIERLTEKLNLMNHITFHGFKSGKELDIIFEQSHIAVSNLGTFRKNIRYTSPLKSKEYCSRGIPFFYTCIDQDFTTFPYSLQIPSNETPIDIVKVLDFYDNLKCDEAYNLKMRNFAFENLSWENKMKTLIAFMRKL